MAESGDVVVYNLRIYLNRGEELLINEAQAGQGLPEGSVDRPKMEGPDTGETTEAFAQGAFCRAAQAWSHDAGLGGEPGTACRGR